MEESDIFIQYSKHKTELLTIIADMERQKEEMSKEYLTTINLMKAKSPKDGEINMTVSGKVKKIADVGTDLEVTLKGYALYSGDEIALGDGMLGVAVSREKDSDLIKIVNNKAVNDIPIQTLEENPDIFITRHFNMYTDGDMIAVSNNNRRWFLYSK